MNLTYKKLDEVCEILDSQRVPITASERKAGQYPYYGANGVQDYVADFIFDDELVLLAEDGGNFGSKERPIAYRVSGKCWVNNHAHVLKPRPEIDVDYLCYALMFYDTTSLVNGATRQKLTQAAMRQMKIPFRSMKEQKTIVQKISAAASLITIRKTQLQKLDQLASSRFIEMFGDPVTNPKRWEKISLSNICNIGSSKRIFEREYVSHGIPFYRTKELVERAAGKKIATELFISIERFNEIKAKFGTPQKNDLLISAVGTIGVIWIVDETQFYFKDGNILRIEASENFNSIFLKFVLEQLIREYKKQMSAGTAYAALTIVNLKKMEIFDIPLELQNEFAAFIEQLDKSKVTIRKSIEKLETTYRALLQEYFEIS